MNPLAQHGPPPVRLSGVPRAVVLLWLGRRGYAAPLAVTGLVLIFILGIALLSAGTGEYMQASLVLYDVKARMLANSALREAHAGLREKLATEDGFAEVMGMSRDEFLADLEARDDGGTLPSGVLASWDARTLAPTSAEMAARAGGELGLLQVEFRGFRRIKTDPLGVSLDADDAFYRHPILDGDADEPPPGARVRDFFGYCTMQVEVNLQAGRRVMTHRSRAVHDVKVIPDGPYAPEHVLFSFLTTFADDPLPELPPDSERMREDLNQGGALQVFGHDEGRILLQGPYHMDSRGFPPPLPGVDPAQAPAGSNSPPQTETFFAQRSGYPGGYGRTFNLWGLTPHPRGAVVAPVGPPIISAFLPGQPQARPGHWYKFDLGTVIYAAVNLFTGIEFWLGGLGGAILGDPGMNLLNNGWWWTETEPHSPSAFSMLGDPRNYRTSAFKGVLLRNTGADGDSGEFEVSGVYQRPPELDGIGMPLELGYDNSRSYIILPEGRLLGRYYRAQITVFPLSLGYQVNVARQGGGMAHQFSREGMEAYLLPYGLHWSPPRAPNPLATLLVDILSIGTGYGVGHEIGDEMWKHLLAGFTAGTLTNEIVSDLFFPSTVFSNPGEESGADANRFLLPSRYRDPVPLAMARYARLSDYPGLIPWGDVDYLVLDGPIWIDDLTHSRPIIYRGRGALVSDARVNESPYLTAPIVARDQLALETEGEPALFGTIEGGPDADLLPLDAQSDHLAIIFLGHDTANWREAGMLRFRSVNALGQSYGPKLAAPVHATVFSLHGVVPHTSEDAIRIMGNLVCGYVNKRHIPGDARLEVHFRRGLAGGQAVHTGLSPRLAGYGGG